MALNTYSLDLELGSAQYAKITDAAQTGLDIVGDLTMECWVRHESVPTAGNVQNYVSKCYTTNRYAYAFIIEHTGGALNLGIGIDAATSLVYKFTPWTPSLATWYHIAVSYDASAGSAQFYVDGVAQGSAVTALPTSINNNDEDFCIGAYRNDGLNPFDGLIDEVRIWDDIRSEAELLANKSIHISGSSANLKGYWRLNNNYLDETSNNNDLTAVNTPVFSTTVPFAGTSDTQSLFFAQL